MCVCVLLSCRLHTLPNPRLPPCHCATEKGAKAAMAAKDRISDDGIKNWEDDLSSKKPLAAAPAEDIKDIKPAKARGGVSSEAWCWCPAAACL